MGNSQVSKKESPPKRRASLTITTTNMSRNDNVNEGEQPINNLMKSSPMPKLRINTPRDQINLLSPMNNKLFNAGISNHDQKDRGKISISTYHSANTEHDNNYHGALFKTPPSNKRQRKSSLPFLSPNQTQQHKQYGSLMRSSSAINAKLFSPSINKSQMSLSTASPTKFAFRQYEIHSPKRKFQITSQCADNPPISPQITQKSESNKTDGRQLEINEIVVAGRFRLIKKLGKGSFGVAYQSYDLLTDETIAIKLERKRQHRQRNISVNMREIIILEKLESCHRVPRLIWHGQYKQYQVMALELQGMNLCDLYEGCGKEFSLKTVIYILIECILCMQDIHSKGIVHRDIKPQNFIISKNPNSNKIFVIDFGLSSWFINSVGDHIDYNDECSPVGTARYASLSNHRGVHQTRRDDLESIGYMICFFLKKELPWQGIREPHRVRKWRKILQKKESTSSHTLTTGLPMEFCYYLDYVKKLKYSEKPDYSKLIRVLKKLYVAQGYYAQDMQRRNPKLQGESYQKYNGNYDFNIADLIVPDWKQIHS